MAEIINFEKLAIKKLVKNRLAVDEMKMEILITVIRFVYAYVEKELNDPLEAINPQADLYDLYDGDRFRFAHTFVELIKYWEIGEINWQDLPYENEFENFKKVEDLCVFIEEKIYA